MPRRGVASKNSPCWWQIIVSIMAIISLAGSARNSHLPVSKSDTYRRHASTASSQSPASPERTDSTKRSTSRWYCAPCCSAWLFASESICSSLLVPPIGTFLARALLSPVGVSPSWLRSPCTVARRSSTAVQYGLLAVYSAPVLLTIVQMRCPPCFFHSFSARESSRSVLASCLIVGSNIALYVPTSCMSCRIMSSRAMWITSFL